MDREFVKPKRWEGKPWSFKFKYLMANYPEIAIGSFMIFAISPIFMAYQLYKCENGREKAIQKYKTIYRVVRDDDPRLPEITAQKEYGREYFPQ